MTEVVGPIGFAVVFDCGDLSSLTSLIDLPSSFGFVLTSDIGENGGGTAALVVGGGVLLLSPGGK